MARHSIDNRSGQSAARLRRFAEVERRQAPEGGHPAVRALSRRPQEAGSGGQRLVQFLRIARGHHA